MSRRIVFSLYFLLCWALPVSAHQPILLDTRQATPGLRLEMHGFSQTAESTAAKYHLRPLGFPKGVKLLLWAKEFDHSIHQLASVFQVDKSGNVVEPLGGAKGSRKLEEMTFGPGPYPRGALWEVALVSVDRKLQAFASIIPYPISVRDGACEIALQLVSHRGEKFQVSGSGFLPGDVVLTESRYAGRVIDKRVRTSGNGSLSPQVILHANTGSDRSARFAVKGHSCELAVDYEWGEAALVRR